MINALLLQILTSQKAVQITQQVPFEDQLQTLVLPQYTGEGTGLPATETTEFSLLVTVKAEDINQFNQAHLLSKLIFLTMQLERFGGSRVAVIETKAENVKDGLYEAVEQAIDACISYK